MTSTKNHKDTEFQSQAAPFSETDDEPSISLIDVLFVISKNYRLIGKLIVACTFIALVSALIIPRQYTSSAKVIREAAVESRGNISGGLAALRGLGINLGSGTVGITVDTYPSILQSREVILAVARSQFHFADVDSAMSLVEYYNRPPGLVGMVFEGLKSITVGLPRTIGKLLAGEPIASLSTDKDNSDFLFVTEEEAEILKHLSKLISVKVDRVSGIMTISATTTDPFLSAQIINVAIHFLTENVQALYTQKAKENVKFIRQRFDEAAQELEEAEEELAQFIDRNRDPETANLRTAMERLQRQVSFKTQLYSELQSQLTTEEIDLQRNLPVITLLERPMPPIHPSRPSRKVIVILGFFFGAVLGVSGAYLKEYREHLNSNQETQAKLQKVRESLSSISIPFRRKRSH